MKIKGSGNKYYDVNIEELTCTCRDWTCRRHNFSKDNPRRLCKHLTEAIELNKLVTSSDDTMLSDNSETYSLSKKLKESDYIIRYNIAKRCYDSLLPIVVRLTYNTMPYDIIDEVLGDDYHLVTTYNNGLRRVYDGPIKLLVVISNYNYPFQSLYYRLGREKFIELSSTIIRRRGLKLTENGLLDGNNEIIDLNISTEEEIYYLIDMDEPIE